MNQNDYLDSRQSVLLDLLRGLSALAVMLGHAVQLGLYTGYWPFSASFQHNAVVLFFVLSGIVISHSADRPGTSLASYARARARRILPVAIVAIFLGAGAWHAVTVLGGPRAGPAYTDVMEPGAIVSAALFLSERFQSGPPGNPPYWSLCYEVMYYALFGAFCFLRGWRRIGVLLWLVVLAGIEVLLLFPAWLAGVAVVALWRRWQPGWWLSCGMLGVALFLFPILGSGAVAYAARMAFGAAVGLDMDLLANAQGFVTDNLLALVVAIGLFGLRGTAVVWQTVPPRVAGLARFLAAISFSLYLSHWPVMWTMRAMGLSAGGNVVFALLLLAIPLGFATLMSLLLERPVWARMRVRAA